MSNSSKPSQISFDCHHCHKPIYIPVGLPPTSASCPHCGGEVTSPDQSLSMIPIPASHEAPEESVDKEIPIAEQSSKITEPEPPTENEVSNNEPAVTEKQENGKRSMAPLIIAIVTLLLASIVILWVMKKWMSNKDLSPVVDKAETQANLEETWRKSGWKQDASMVLNAFMSATSPEERAKYVIPNQGVLEELKIFYPEGQDDADTPIESFGHVVGADEDQKRGIYLMQYSQPVQLDIREYFAPIGSLEMAMGLKRPTMLETAYRIDESNLSQPVGIKAFFKKIDRGLKLDSSVFIQGKFRTFRAFIDYPRPGKTKLFRVLIGESLVHEFRDDKRYRTYLIQDFAYANDYINVPVLTESETGKILSVLNWRGLNRDGTVRTATVELGWTNDTPSKLELVKVICWEFIGVGGEIGNTIEKTPPAPISSDIPEEE